MTEFGEPMTRREYLIRKAILDGASPSLAIEAVSSVALEHPEWDSGETRTWDAWETLP